MADTNFHDELAMITALSVAIAVESDPGRKAIMEAAQLKLFKVAAPRIQEYLTSVEIPP